MGCFPHFRNLDFLISFFLSLSLSLSLSKFANMADLKNKNKKIMAFMDFTTQHADLNLRQRIS